MTFVPVRRSVVVLTLVCVVGLALAAAALGTGTFTVGGEGPPVEPAEPTGLTGSEAATLLVLLYVAVAIFAIAGAIMAIRSGHATPTRLALLVLGLASLGFVVAALAVLTGTALPAFDMLTPFEVFGTGAEGAPATPSDEGGQPAATPIRGGGAGLSTVLPAVVLVILIALIGVGLVGVNRLLLRSGPELPERGRTDEPDAAALGRAAGLAADRFDAASVENPIYRAWVEMVRPLDVGDPETATPADFATAAIEAGLDPADVRALTEHFRAVRYGDAPVTTERVEAARETLRRIEAAHADDSGRTE